MNIQDLLASSATQSNASSSSSTSKTDAAVDSLNETYNNFLLLLTKQLRISRSARGHRPVHPAAGRVQVEQRSPQQEPGR
jgi:hypothetical protein